VEGEREGEGWKWVLFNRRKMASEDENPSVCGGLSSEPRTKGGEQNKVLRGAFETDRPAWAASPDRLKYWWERKARVQTGANSLP